jgi:hypothetical protein
MRRINEAIKIDKRLKNENKKIEKKSGTNFALIKKYEVAEYEEKKFKTWGFLFIRYSSNTYLGM